MKEHSRSDVALSEPASTKVTSTDSDDQEGRGSVMQFLLGDEDEWRSMTKGGGRLEDRRDVSWSTNVSSAWDGPRSAKSPWSGVRTVGELGNTSFQS